MRRCWSFSRMKMTSVGFLNVLEITSTIVGLAVFSSKMRFFSPSVRKTRLSSVIQHAVNLPNGSPSIFSLLFPSSQWRTFEATVTTTGPASLTASCKRDDACAMNVSLDILYMHVNPGESLLNDSIFNGFVDFFLFSRQSLANKNTATRLRDTWLSTQKSTA